MVLGTCGWLGTARHEPSSDPSTLQVTEVGKKEKQCEVEGTLRALNCPVLQPTYLGFPREPEKGCNGVLALQGKTSLLCSAPAEVVSPVLLYGLFLQSSCVLQSFSILPCPQMLLLGNSNLWFL